MKDIIIQKLNEIEEKENVKVIFAVESGSRAWGFDSADSDYDVRFIYLRNLEFYLKLEKTRDVIEWQLDETLDINGWDLKKALCLLYKSNPTFFEWANSPIIYRTSEQWEKIKEKINDYFSVKPSFWHYLNMAKSNYKLYLKNDMVKLKKYFYVLRPVLACKWVIQKETPPPMEFEKLVDSQLDEELKTIVFNLIDMKRNSNETELIHKIDVINEYIEKQFIILKNIAEQLPNEKEKFDEELNKLFLNILYEKDLKV